jgi:hypothetical protein
MSLLRSGSLTGCTRQSLTADKPMRISSAVRDRPVPVLYGLMIVSLVALLPLSPLLQDQSYHQFADQRELFGIPNFWNVVSNLPFIVVGTAGLLRFRGDATTLVLFTGLFLTAPIQVRSATR